jgi:peroxiredoxin
LLDKWSKPNARMPKAYQEDIMPSTATVPDIDTVMPDLALVSADGVAMNLHAVRGTRPAVTYFLRASDCPICLRHARALAELAESDRLGGASVILIAPGGADEAREVAAKVPSRAVTALASGDGHAAAGMGTFLSVQHSGTFLISAEGTVRYRRTAAVPLRSLDRKELLAAIAR